LLKSDPRRAQGTVASKKWQAGKERCAGSSRLEVAGKQVAVRKEQQAERGDPATFALISGRGLRGMGGQVACGAGPAYCKLLLM
jgi:hypothetical protein